MKRTQLYLDEKMWTVLEILSRQSGSSVSELVRQAVREKYLGQGKNRAHVLRSAVGLWKDRDDLPDTETYVHALRKDSRLNRLGR